MARNIDSESFSWAFPPAIERLDDLPETFSCAATNGLSADAGLRCSRTFSAAFASAGINGLASVKASYDIRTGCQRFSHSATCGVTMALTIGCMKAR